MSNYSELCKGSDELLGTGRGTCAKSLGSDIKFFLSDPSFTGTDAQLKTKAYWDAAILAKTVIPFPEVKEIEPQNVEAAYYETPSGDSYKMKNEKRKTMYKFVENIVTHSGMKSYSDQGWNIWFYTKNGYLRGHTKGVDSYEGLKVSNFYVNAQETPTFDAVEQTPVIMEHDNVDDWDMEFYVGQPDFNMLDLEGIYQTELKVLSATQATGTLTVNVSLSVSGSNTALSGVLPASFSLIDAAGDAVVVDSAAESPTGTYAVVATDTATSGTIQLSPNTIGSDNYQSSVVTFTTA